MSHEIETTAWRLETPWHGLGTKVADNLSPEQMLNAAQLNWRVTKEPMFHTHGADALYTQVPEHYALVRDTDGRVLDVVGSRYQPTQNADAFEFFNEFVHAGGLEMDTAGSLFGGQWVWGLASLKEGFKLANGDTILGNVLLASPHRQGKSLIIRFTPTRVVCWNTLSWALGSHTTNKTPEFRMGHRNKFDSAMIKKARSALGIAREQLDAFEVNVRALASKSMTTADVKQILHPFFQPDITLDNLKADKLNPKFAAVMEAYALAPGADLAMNTAWGALNAVTYYFDHMAGKSRDTRLGKSWLGRNAGIKDQVMEALLVA